MKKSGSRSPEIVAKCQAGLKRYRMTRSEFLKHPACTPELIKSNPKLSGMVKPKPPTCPNTPTHE